MTYFQTVPGQVIASAHMNAAIQQGIPPFADPAARDAAIPAPSVGQACFLTNILQFQGYNASAGWHPIGGIMPSAILDFAGPAGATAGTNRLVWPTANVTARVMGGLTNAADGGILLAYRGMYQISVSITTSGYAANAKIVASFGTTTAVSQLGADYGTNSGGGGTAIISTQDAFAAGTYCYAYLYAPVAGSITSGRMTAHYLGAINF